MAASKIEWNIAICASTYAELGEAWASLRAVSTKLNNPDGGSVLSQVEASQDFDQAVTSVTKALQGLDNFLNIQGAYLERIRADYHPAETPRRLVVDQSLAAELEKVLQELSPLHTEQAEAGFQGEAPEVIPGQEPPVLPLYQPQPALLADWNRHVNYGESPDLKQIRPTPDPWPLAIRYRPG